MAILGFSIGLGTVTRFPYLAARNGGGAFLIPFALFITIAEAPLFYLEAILGQFSGKSPMGMWEICPAFRGVGIACTIMASIHGKLS